MRVPPPPPPPPQAAFLVPPRPPPRRRLQPSLPPVSFLRGAGSKEGKVLGLLLCCIEASATTIPLRHLLRRQRRAVPLFPNPRLRPSIMYGQALALLSQLTPKEAVGDVCW
ncbi:hypothetical protein U9M48_042402 [Paspalum notatum var. saurae]|uniref:Uncharacterized protein n=1 Tax=Paspalum notatum var. saurae TaxID=547442 RepID=A0AAQ3UQG7_PASNO